MQCTPGELKDHLIACAQGDWVAFAALYQATSLKLFGIVLRILKDQAHSEDVLQEVYVTIWRQAARYDPDRASPITWMGTIARNRAIDVLRRQKGQGMTVEIEIDTIVDPSRSAPDELERSQAYQALAACLEALDPNRAKMVRLAYLEGASRQDLADLFGQPVNTIKTWLHRSLKQLKECLGS
jgi:RNA polymerase sigma factor (sigma-70 family)